MYEQGLVEIIQVCQSGDRCIVYGNVKALDGSTFKVILILGHSGDFDSIGVSAASCQCHAQQLCQHVCALGLYVHFNRKGITLEHLGLAELKWRVEGSHCIHGNNKGVFKLLSKEAGFKVSG